ncbi:uncharacterized protein LOC126894981 [Daktulosphaira vitifoliae]|uniref:uncharacterized protein LOC126894981 n=1 Tax=Daktulosphaira vitifoliae TaxID=58002 RepID=UPI0021A990C9|nr:uncharacterized protein LOC126894981 [Daktulosphaira vitifoliae]
MRLRNGTVFPLDTSNVNMDETGSDNRPPSLVRSNCPTYGESDATVAHSNNYNGTTPASNLPPRSDNTSAFDYQQVLSPHPANSNIDINNTLLTLLEQNRLLINHLLERDASSANGSVSTASSNSASSDSYYVMPNFHNTLPVFLGQENKIEAADWLQSIKTVSKLHRWPDTFKLETAFSKIDGPAKHWIQGRNFNSWDEFEQKFKATFIGPELSMIERMKRMTIRVQSKNESLVEYFHDKCRLCRALKLPFNEARLQIIEGLYSEDMCHYLLARNHINEDELLSDIMTYNSVITSRAARFVPKYQQNSKSVKVNKPQSQIRCYRCNQSGHYSSSCENPASSGSCFRCGSQEHRIRDCPKPAHEKHVFKTNNLTKQNDDQPSRSAMVLQTTPDMD